MQIVTRNGQSINPRSKLTTFSATDYADMVKTLTPPVDTAELDDQVPSNDVTLLVSVKSPCATTAVEESSADTARVTSVNMAGREGCFRCMRIKYIR